MRNPVEVARSWRRAHPYAAAWLVSRAVYSFLFMLGISKAKAELGYLSGGRLTQWASEHGILAMVLMATLPVLLLDPALRLISPLLGKPEQWPVADQDARYAIESALRRIPVWQAVCAFFAALLALGVVSYRSGSLPGVGGALLVVTFAFYFYVDLRPSSEPRVPFRMEG